MTGAQMIDLLALRLEDADKKKFPDSFKLKALNNAQIRVAQMLDNHYLTELQVLDANITVTSGAALMSLLTYDVLRGSEGIQMIQNYAGGGLYMNMIDIKNIKTTENTYLGGSTENPLGYIFSNTIYILPTSIVAIDVWYLKMPTPILNKFTKVAHGTPQDVKFLGDAGQGLSAVNDTYGGGTNNNSVIYSLTHESYHVVTDYVAANREFTVEPAASSNFGTGEFYLLTHDFDLLTLSGITSDLNESLHDLIVTFAEAECWTMSGAGDAVRRQAALDNAFTEIKILNDRYTPVSGIGTEGNR